MRLAFLTILLFLSVGCGGEPAKPSANGTQLPVRSSTLVEAARELLPAAVTTSPSLNTDRCLGTFERPVRCAVLHVRGAGERPAERKRAFLDAARRHGWQLRRMQTASGSSTLVFHRGKLEGRVLMSHTADVTIVSVTEPAATTADEARFVADGRAACERFADTVGRIPNSLPRAEGLRRVRTTWHRLVNDVSRLTPPSSLRQRHHAFVAALRAFERALLPFRPLRIAEAANRVERSARAVGLNGCIPD